jgi:uncharacterized protein with NRDE domain
MCLILLAWQVHPDYPLIVAANRDEFFARPTAPAAFWPEAPEVLAGRDLQAGGTWLGITRSSRFAALTNYRDPAQNRHSPSRGRLAADFLIGNATPQNYLACIAASGVRYNGYNLLLGDGQSLWWATNVAGERAVRALPPGIYGLSNDQLDTPWPKVGAGKTALRRAIDALPDDRPLFHLLRDDFIHPDEHLPSTGVSQAWERLLSAAFVRSPSYGTRSSTVIYQHKNGWVTFDEQTWMSDAQPGPRTRYHWQK